MMTDGNGAGRHSLGGDEPPQGWTHPEVPRRTASGAAGKWIPPEQMPGAARGRPETAGAGPDRTSAPVAAPTAAAAVATVTRPESMADGGKGRKVSDGKSAERRLAFWLVAPSALLMALVTGYPIIYAFWLSLNKESLSAPGERSFVWFSNYSTVLSDGYWWTAFGVTMFITVVSVVIELVLGMAIALVMHRTIFGKGVIRTVVLIPYGIVTVAAAFSWYYAWTPGTGYLANLLPAAHRSPSSGRRCSSSSSPRCGRPPRSWRCCCWPDWRWFPTTCSRRLRSTAPVRGRGWCASSSR
mgnify:CR=1 FL=1